MKYFVQLIVSALAVFGAAYLLPGVKVTDFLTAILVAFVLSILNTIVKPLLVFFTIPITLVTLGLFLLVINAFIIILADKLITTSFEVKSFWSALLFSLLVSVLTSIINYINSKFEKSN